ncbi:MAG: glycosyltransferase family 39 protein, partial [Thermoanaerobaculia bacterium]
MKSRILPGLLFLCLGAFLASKTSYVAGGSDSSGYLNAARLFTEGRVTERVEPLARFGLSDARAPLFTPLGFTQAGRPGSIAPSYPPGLPLHMAAAALLFGWKHAPFLVAPLASLVCLWLMYLVGRQLQLPPAFAAAGAAVLGFFPTFAAYSLQSMSDVPATAWTLAAVLAALRSRRSPHAAFLAGAAFAVAVLVRPTNALLLAPLLAALPSRPGILARAALGGLPLAALLLAYNAAAFGSPWRTGYGTLEGQMALGNFG